MKYYTVFFVCVFSRRLVRWNMFNKIYEILFELELKPRVYIGPLGIQINILRSTPLTLNVQY